MDERPLTIYRFSFQRASGKRHAGPSPFFRWRMERALSIHSITQVESIIFQIKSSLTYTKVQVVSETPPESGLKKTRYFLGRPKKFAQRSPAKDLNPDKELAGSAMLFSTQFLRRFGNNLAPWYTTFERSKTAPKESLWDVLKGPFRGSFLPFEVLVCQWVVELGE